MVTMGGCASFSRALGVSQILVLLCCPPFAAWTIEPLFRHCRRHHRRRQVERPPVAPYAGAVGAGRAVEGYEYVVATTRGSSCCRTHQKQMYYTLPCHPTQMIAHILARVAKHTDVVVALLISPRVRQGAHDVVAFAPVVRMTIGRAALRWLAAALLLSAVLLRRQRLAERLERQRQSNYEC
jgi:hypothetical protein